MNREQLLLRAKELGIKDAESLKGDALKVAVKAAELRLGLVKKAKDLGVDHSDETTSEDLSKLIEAASLRLALVNEAKEHGIDVLPEMTSEDLQNLILATQISTLTENNSVLEHKVYALANVLGIDDHSELDAEGLTKAASAIIAALTTVVDAEEVTEEKQVVGKTEQAFKSANGKEFQFKDAAPAAFRFMGSVRTQKEWIKDKEAMELMIVGNVSYIELKRK
jgi:hypothetical protein